MPVQLQLVLRTSHSHNSHPKKKKDIAPSWNKKLSCQKVKDEIEMKFNLI